MLLCSVASEVGEIGKGTIRSGEISDCLLSWSAPVIVRRLHCSDNSIEMKNNKKQKAWSFKVEDLNSAELCVFGRGPYGGSGPGYQCGAGFLS